MRNITFIDLFAGVGGLSEGFISAGFTPVAHVEMDANACNTLKTRACWHYLKENNQTEKYYDYLRTFINRDKLYSFVPESLISSIIQATMSNASMETVFGHIDNSLKTKGIDHVGLIIGGPPCQAYSQVGRSRKCMDNDPRNELYKLYRMALVKYKPEMFLFENVPGLITAGEGLYIKRIQRVFKYAGYEVEYRILNASDFGVLQDRKRVIIIGWKRGTDHSYPVFDIVENLYRVEDIFNDLSRLQAGESSNNYGSATYSKYLHDTGIRTEKDILTWHIARNNMERDREIYGMAIRAWNDYRRRFKYSDLPDNLSTHKNKSGFLDRFKIVAADLPTSHTLMAHISKDGHYYIHPDIRQTRSITVREAARIQSFPDNYFFEGSRTSAFRQIGNAVPPLMAKSLAIALLKQF